MVEKGNPGISKRKVRPFIPRSLYGLSFLLLCTGSILFTTSFHRVPTGYISISDYGYYDSDYYFELPWEYTQRINVPLKGNTVVFPALMNSEGVMYEKCKLMYDIYNAEKFATVVCGNINEFTMNLIRNVSILVETTEELPEPLYDNNYIKSSAFDCIIIKPSNETQT